MVFVYSYKEPMVAHATPVVAVAGCVLAGLGLSALGVYIAASVGQPQAQAFCQDCYDACKTAIDRVTYFTEESGKVVAHMGTEALQAIGDYFENYKNSQELVQQSNALFPHGFYFANPTMGADFLNNAFDTTYFGDNFNGHSILYGDIYLKAIAFVSVIDAPAVKGTNTSAMTTGGTVSTYCSGYYSSAYTEFTYKQLSITIPGMSSVFSVSVPADSQAKSVGTTYDHSILAIVQFIDDTESYCLLTPSYKATAAVTSGYVSSSTSYPNTKAQGFIGPVPMKKIAYSGKSIGATGENVQSVIDALKARVGKLEADGTHSVPLTNTGSNTAVDTHNATQTQAQTTGATATAAETAASTAANEGQDTSTAKPEELPDLSLPKLITKKFPFCIPFDIYTIISGFYCSTAKAPHWEIPVKNTRLGWDWKIVIDWAQFEPVAVVCRWFNGAAWVFALILITRKLIGAGGGN
jgi:hypothetical protein